MACKIIKLENCSRYDGYITYDKKNKIFHGGGKKEDAVKLKQIEHPKRKNVHYYKVKGKKRYMNVVTKDRCKIKGSKPFNDLDHIAAWSMIDNKLSSFQYERMSHRFLSLNNEEGFSNQLYASLSGEFCIVSVEDADSKKVQNIKENL